MITSEMKNKLLFDHLKAKQSDLELLAATLKMRLEMIEAELTLIKEGLNERTKD